MYKLFIIIIVISQVYSIFFQVINLFTIITNNLLIFYLVFRYHLLYKLSKKFKNFNILLPKSLKESDNNICESCGRRFNT